MKKKQRIYIPGSEWVYIKLYTGSTSAEKILIHEIPRIISKLRKKRQIVKWFFIRYADPNFHLRIRLLVTAPSAVGEVLLLFHKHLKKYVDDNVIWKMQVDTYIRELERYKEHLIELTESLFHIDSVYTLSILRILHKTPSDNLRWMIAMKMIDALLDLFGYNVKKKQYLLEQMDNSFKSEFGFNEFNGKQLNQLYRQYTNGITAVMEENKQKANFLSLYKLIQERSVVLQKIVDEIRSADNKDESIYLLPNYIHMMMNRMFCSRNRIYELVIYNFLNRFYRSKIARIKSMII